MSTEGVPHDRPRPFYSVGLLFDLTTAETPFLGTCFAYGSKSHFLTAAHCVGRLQAAQLGIVLPLIDHADFIRVESLVKHPKADLALLRVEPVASDELLPFVGLSPYNPWGGNVQAVGYPEDTTDEGLKPTARLFSGSVQRFFTHHGRGGYVYLAGELSFGAPAGLSGGPVIGGASDRVIGVVAENHDATTFLQSVLEIQENNSFRKESIHEVIRYGIFVLLPALRDWLEQEAPGLSR